jgi:GcrA cell cycle regulator
MSIRETWTSERVEMLKHWFNAGLSCSQIAGQIGATRNAVIGKLHRLGLTRPERALEGRLDQARDPSRPRPVRRKPWRLSVHAQREMLKASYPDSRAETPVVDSAHTCTLLELRHAQCRWPINEPGSADFAFCGNTAVDGLSYCVGHARIAYRMPGRARRYGGG